MNKFTFLVLDVKNRCFTCIVANYAVLWAWSNWSEMIALSFWKRLQFHSFFFHFWYLWLIMIDDSSLLWRHTYSQGPNIRTFFCHQFYDKSPNFWPFFFSGLVWAVFRECLHLFTPLVFGASKLREMGGKKNVKNAVEVRTISDNRVQKRKYQTIPLAIKREMKNK